MTADVDDVIDTAADPVESLVVTGGTITSELHVVRSVLLLHQKIVQIGGLLT